MARIKPPFKYYGGKFYLSQWIATNLADSQTYVEPFGGAGSVLLNKPRSPREVYNDLNGDIAHLMTLIRDDFHNLKDAFLAIPCEKSAFDHWKLLKTDDPFRMAIKTYVVHRMSRGGQGVSFSKSTRTYRGLPENVAAWETGLANLEHVHRRLQGVEIRSECATKTIADLDATDTTFYLDPPYVLSTRESKSMYQFEMDEPEHRRLATILNQCKGKIVLSGYDSPLYNELFPGWNSVRKHQFLHAGTATKKKSREEVLWKNF